MSQHSSHIPKHVRDAAKKATPRGATREELTEHARDVGQSVKGRAASSKMTVRIWRKKG